MWHFKFKSFLGEDLSDNIPAIRKNCDIGGCDGLGEFRAPKSRYELRDYYWFCLDHVREYNANWDFFKGMSRIEIEHHMHKTAVWDRPTWRSTQAGFNEEKTRQRIYEAFTKGESVFGDFSGRGPEDEEPVEAHIDIRTIPHPTIEALAVLDLYPPIDWDQVKIRYKTLAKKYHPDTNKEDKTAEELLKKINLAYSILKLSYQHYTNLEK
ncbi:MAG: J domain-containing protein [Micavibrio sp.]|nr:J domain-containing protein [Micavibrio sp.]